MMLKTYRLWMHIKTLVMIILLAFFSWPSVAAGTPWDLLGQDDVYAVYIDEGSMTLISDTASKVWIKVVPKGRDYKEDILKSRKEEGLTAEGYENYAYRIESVEIECALERHRVLETADYDGNDCKLSTSFPVSGWRETRSGTPYASLAKVICQQHSEEDDWWDHYPAHQSHEEE
ncbi:MAG: surface-adhesin E family protein [Pseudomonadota bacterium]